MRERPTLILIHRRPAFIDHSAFKPAFSRLADTAQLIYLGLRGGGRSAPSRRGASHPLAMPTARRSARWSRSAIASTLNRGEFALAQSLEYLALPNNVLGL